MKRVIMALITGVFIGCANNQPQPNENTAQKVVKTIKEKVDICELNYKKCEAECKLTLATAEDWKKTACIAKCKTIFSACKTKEYSIKGFNYTKEKTIEGYQYIKQKINE